MQSSALNVAYINDKRH